MEWVREQIRRIATQSFDVWLIGSVAAAKPNPEDCDLLLIAPIYDLEAGFEAINSLKNSFLSAFGLPLHLTIISTEELEDCREFLSKVFQEPNIRL